MIGDGTRRADLAALYNGRAAGRFALDMLSWQTTDESSQTESSRIIQLTAGVVTPKI